MPIYIPPEFEMSDEELESEDGIEGLEELPGSTPRERMPNSPAGTEDGVEALESI